MMEFRKQVAWSTTSNDKNNKHHKYTTVETLRAVLELNDESNYLDLLGRSLKYQSNNCNQLQLVFVPEPLQQKQRDASNSCLLFRLC